MGFGGFSGLLNGKGDVLENSNEIGREFWSVGSLYQELFKDLVLRLIFLLMDHNALEAEV